MVIVIESARTVLLGEDQLVEPYVEVCGIEVHLTDRFRPIARVPQNLRKGRQREWQSGPVAVATMLSYRDSGEQRIA